MPSLMTSQINRERTLKGLARNLFKIQGRGSTELLRRAEEALLRANPFLNDAQGFRRGRVVIVPNVPGAAPSDRVRAREKDSNAGSLERFERNLKDITRTTAQRIEKATERATDTSKKLKSRPFQRAILKEAPELDSQLPELSSQAEKRLGELEKRSKMVKETLKRANADLKKFKEKLGTPEIPGDS